MQFLAKMIGYIVAAGFLLGVVITIGELIWYRLPSKEKGAYNKRIALITGATGGLGRELALRLDKKLRDIDEYWLVGRREERLSSAAKALGHQARCLPLDLRDEGSVDEIKALLQKENARVGLILNCAGLGKIGSAADMPAEDIKAMLDVNVRAAVMLTEAGLPFMRGGDRIINVCSTAAFQPFQYLNVYAASKAFLLRYSRALRTELLPRRIAVTAVCPYWIKDTEFIKKAKPEKRSGIRSFPLASKVSSVASLAVFGSGIGLPVVTPGVISTLHRIFASILPDTAMQFIWEGLRRV